MTKNELKVIIREVILKAKSNSKNYDTICKDMAIIYGHLLKYMLLSNGNSGSWPATIRHQSNEIRKLLNKSIENMITEDDINKSKEEGINIFLSDNPKFNRNQLSYYTIDEYFPDPPRSFTDNKLIEEFLKDFNK